MILMSNVRLRYTFEDFRRAMLDTQATADEWDTWGEILLYAGFDPIAAMAVAEGMNDDVEPAAREEIIRDDDEEAVQQFRSAMRVAFYEGLRFGESLTRNRERAVT